MMNAAPTSTLTGAASRLPLLEVRDLTKSFPVRLGIGRTGYVSAVDGVSFDVEPGTTMGIVGESGCGKSTLARLILGLVPANSGEIKIEQDVVDWHASAGRKQLRRNMQMVFQNPYSSLNPRSSFGEIVGFPMRAHGLSRAEIAERTASLLFQVGLHANHSS
jgi:ABC-type glutathione transport system ATPase component